jgi:hypothetical protein
MYIMAPKPISAMYFVNHSHWSVCLHVYPTVVARQWLSKNHIVVMNTCATMVELLDASLSVGSMLYQRKVGVSFSQNLY